MIRSRITTAFTAVGLLGIGLAVLAPSARAAGTADTVTINGVAGLTIVSGASLHVTADAQATCSSGSKHRTVSLALVGPAGSDSATTSLATVSKPCDRTVTIDTTITPPARNGAFSVTLQNGMSKDTTTASLDVLIPPTRTDDVTVKTRGTTATFKWRPNPEADLTMYELVTPSDKVVTSVTASAACKPGHHCKAQVDLGRQVAGKTRLYAMRAVRCGLSCTGTDVIGPPSVSVAASFTNAPPATPTPTPPTGGTNPSGGSGGGYVPPPSTGTGSGSGTGGGSSSGPGKASGGHHHLHPTKPATPPTTGSTRHNHQKAAPATSVSTAGSGTAVRGVATALILLLIAAHVISWASRTNFD